MEPENKPIKAQPLRPKTKNEIKRGLLEIEERVHSQSMSVMEDALHFAKLAPEAEAPPESWVDSIGEERAWERFRLAKAAQLPAQHAPSGLKIAMAITTSLVKARANDVTDPSPVNINVVQIDLPPKREYPVKKVIDV